MRQTSVRPREFSDWPCDLDIFAGRRRELLEIKNLLAECRPVTLTGPGGVGRSRLARRAAAGLLPACAALVDMLLRACPELRILVTGRLPLGLAGETIFSVRPLPTPDRAQILEFLADRFALLSPGTRTAPNRHRTPGACVDRLFALGSPPELRLWARLSGFPDAFELDAVQGVYADADLPAEKREFAMTSQLVNPLHHGAARAAGGGLLYADSRTTTNVLITLHSSSPTRRRDTAAVNASTSGGQNDAPHVCQRESELRALMSMAAHDLKNPLASVTAHVEMLRTDYGTLGDEFKHDLTTIERGLHRMSRLTQQLLDYARADHTLDLGPTPLNDLVSDVIADHVTTTGTIRVTVTGTLPTVVADTALLRHVLDNLIGNAIKYTPAGATPEIEVHARTLPDGTTRIEVADHGIGIPPTDQPKIFDAFHRCANSSGYPGTGLGLNICQRIIERHGGQIGVEDNPGGGSRFWLTLTPWPVRCGGV